MIAIRQSSDRGHTNHGWLDAYHSFSFGEYHAPQHMGFRSLRVLNEDRIQPGQGFGTHPHRDMEIITYVLEGSLQHKDSMGHGSVLQRGQFQHMTAGTGVLHSEFNPSDTDLVHLYQIWILPNRQELTPSYEERAFSDHKKRGHLKLVASEDGQEGSLTIHQDVKIFLSCLPQGQTITHALAPNRYAWLQVLRGGVQLNGHSLTTSDGAALSDERELTILGQSDAEVMLFDLA